MAEADLVKTRCTPEDRPATAAELGEELRKARCGNGFTVDDMAPAPMQHGAVPARVRVVVAEDDVLLREGLASLLDRSGFEVVGQTGDDHRRVLAVVTFLEAH